MKQLNLLKTLFLLCALMVGSLNSVRADNLTVDFEKETSTYTDWVFTNFVTQQTNANVPEHGGDFFGSTDGKTSGSLITKEKIASPQSITFYISKASNNNTASSWLIKVSANGEDWTQVGDAQSASAGITRGEWTEVSRNLSSYSNVYVGIFYDGTQAVRCIDDVALAYTDAGKSDVVLSFPKDSYNADIAEGASSFSAPTATANPAVTPITYTSTNAAVATVNATSGAVTLVKKGQTTIKATFAGDETYNSAEASYTLTVTNSNANDGSLAKPFTVEEAIDFIEAKEYGEGNYYVKGIISRITSKSVSNGTLTYYISDDGTTTNDLQVFKGKNLENASFTDVDEIELGDNVIVVGPLFYYNDQTPEINTGNYIYSLTRKELPTLVVENVEMYIGSDKNLGVLYQINNDYTGMVEFSSSKEDVAVISGSKLQAVGVGVATITVTAPATEKYKTVSKTFTVTVKSRDVAPEGSAATSYVLVTDASTLADGDQILLGYASDAEQYVMGGQNGTIRDAIAATIVNGAISEVPGGAVVFTLEGEKDAWYFKDDTGYLYASSSSQNQIRTEEEKDDNAKATISIEEGSASITFQGTNTRNLLRYNYNSGNPRFCCYGSTSSITTNPQIYRYTESTSFDITMGSDGWRSMVSAQNVSLPDGLEAYIATAETSSSISLTKVDKVVKNTPVLLKGNAGNYTLTIIDEASYSQTNLLKISDAETGNGVFVLAKKGEGVGFYKWNGGKLGAGRVYLDAPVGAHDFLAIDDEATGINSVKGSELTVNGYYNLAGQRVAQPTKGLYIVNGKKVIIK